MKEDRRAPSDLRKFTAQISRKTSEKKYCFLSHSRSPCCCGFELKAKSIASQITFSKWRSQLNFPSSNLHKSPVSNEPLWREMNDKRFGSTILSWAADFVLPYLTTRIFSSQVSRRNRENPHARRNHIALALAKNQPDKNKNVWLRTRP